jgi:hypothetical protein
MLENTRQGPIECPPLELWVVQENAAMFPVRRCNTTDSRSNVVISQMAAVGVFRVQILYPDLYRRDKEDQLHRCLVCALCRHIIAEAPHMELHRSRMARYQPHT